MQTLLGLFVQVLNYLAVSFQNTYTNYTTCILKWSIFGCTVNGDYFPTMQCTKGMEELLTAGNDMNYQMLTFAN